MHRSAEEEEAALELCALGIQCHQQRLRLRRVTLQNLDLSVINKLLSKRSSAISHWPQPRQQAPLFPAPFQANRGTTGARCRAPQHGTSESRILDGHAWHTNAR